MAELKYRITVEHKEKGVGFTAKEALQNAQRQGHGPVVQAKFHKPPCSSGTELEVTVDDSMLTETLVQMIENSGRMPTINGSYRITEVNLLSEEAFESEKANLEKLLNSSNREVSRLTDDNAALRRELGDAKRVIESPLNACLSYFDTLHFSSDMLLDDAADISFARRVLSNDLENCFVNYVNHILGTRLDDEEVAELLEFDSENELAVTSELETAYFIAKSELEFLEKVRSGDAGIPESLLEDTVNVIEGKGHDKTIAEYDSLVAKCSNKKKLHAKIFGLKNNYDTFSEHLDLLESDGLPIPAIFQEIEGGIQIYFPFKSRNAKAGFINDLRREICKYFRTEDVSVIDHNFIGYDVKLIDGRRDYVPQFTEDIPFTLQLLGHNIITPYRLG